MQEPEPQLGQLGRGETLQRLLGRRDLQLLALPDQRAHDVRLAPVGDLGAHVGPHLGLQQPALGPAGHDRRPARRHLVEHAHVEIAVDGHRGGARDRRRRHHEHVGHGAVGRLRPQRRALLDAEAVLLVDDDGSEARELDRFLDQRVGTDGDVDRPVGQAGQHLACGRRP